MLLGGGGRISKRPTSGGELVTLRSAVNNDVDSLPDEKLPYELMEAAAVISTAFSERPLPSMIE